jgi:hypothetical protein
MRVCAYFWFLFCINLHYCKADILFEGLSTSTTIQSSDGADRGYFSLIGEVSNISDDDIYLFTGLDTTPGFKWSVHALRPEGFTGLIDQVMWTTADTTTEDDLLEIKAGYTERLNFSFMVESEYSDTISIEMVEIQFTRSLNEPRLIETVSLDNFQTEYAYLDGNSVVPEPSSLTLLFLGIITLRRMVK